MAGELIAERYELEEIVGTGGMSSVYRAHDQLLERRVALKILHEQFTRDQDYVERFRREARSVAQLTHPNIVTVIDRGEQDGRQFIVFEYVAGENLKELVERAGPLPIEQAVEIGLQVARALSFAHREGLVHRDVKPQNVLLDEDGRAKVTDFGIARLLDIQGMTITGTILGTSSYIAPEQARGEPVDELTDVYSLGVVLFELLTGEVPFEGESFVTVAMKHINEPVPSVRARRAEVPARLDYAVERAMAKDPADRFGSMTEFCRELEACLGELEHGREGEATMIVPPERRRPPPRRTGARPSGRALVLLALSLAALAAAIAAVVFFGSRGEASEKPKLPPLTRFVDATAYDPRSDGGDGHEHDDKAKYAIDGNPSTFWLTETYLSFSKSGVGIYVDAGREVRGRSLTVVTDTPGFKAQIKGGTRPGAFTPISPARTVNGTTRFPLNRSPARYFLVWITDLGGHSSVHVDEIRPR